MKVSTSSLTSHCHDIDWCDTTHIYSELKKRCKSKEELIKLKSIASQHDKIVEELAIYFEPGDIKMLFCNLATKILNWRLGQISVITKKMSNRVQCGKKLAELINLINDTTSFEDGDNEEKANGIGNESEKSQDEAMNNLKIDEAVNDKMIESNKDEAIEDSNAQCNRKSIEVFDDSDSVQSMTPSGANTPKKPLKEATKDGGAMLINVAAKKSLLVTPETTKKASSDGVKESEVSHHDDIISESTKGMSVVSGKTNGAKRKISSPSRLVCLLSIDLVH
jgi:hypothetical protein